MLNVGLTYYTGSVDTVAHIPDRCYIADGFEPTSHNMVTWSAFEGRPGRDDARRRRRLLHQFRRPGCLAAIHAARNVAYFFHANGVYTADPIGVRVLLQDLRQRYAYYSKIELMTADERPESNRRDQ